jgi:hypothetical protein
LTLEEDGIVHGEGWRSGKTVAPRDVHAEVYRSDRNQAGLRCLA